MARMATTPAATPTVPTASAPTVPTAPAAASSSSPVKLKITLGPPKTTTGGDGADGVATKKPKLAESRA
ncbi:hypothetical protein PTSG_13014 [Salpingoeca rosetta]|uniref:Uncharacterized protein n=1 Tax=Salpingoeca rosetta (strain ATCC 50818 / BSB-021) TaxID=946362 RepID=F2UQT2_SALR5|nr:uncharacterized protein PTSG_13014 [Salpingoeca rosetta]EGD79987.1 hypothetical protein PTSG_13014 [Salpingoeca rosetta]|eukprot:XP_004988608.1 hypothetical protein PTSG_13014 [Salpingoeca rosetta]